MSDAGDDAAHGDAHCRLGRRGGFLNGVKILAPRHQIAVAAKVGRQKDLGIDHPAFGAFLQHGQGQVVKVLRGLQRRDGSLIDLEEMPEVGELVGPVLGEKP